MKEESKEKVMLNNTPQKDFANAVPGKNLEEMTDDDFKYVQKIKEQILSLQDSDALEDEEMQAKL